MLLQHVKTEQKWDLKTRWLVNKAQTADGSQLILTLYHEPKTVAESKNGTEWGKQTGGETDAVGQYNIVK